MDVKDRPRHESRPSARKPPSARASAPVRAGARSDVKRALLVTNIPNPYRLPLFDELSRQLDEQGVRLKVLFGGPGYRRRKWDLDFEGCRFDYDVLSSKSIEIGGNVERTLFTYGGLARHIRAFEPDVVVVTGFSPATVRLWLRSWRATLGGASLPYIVWTGSLKERPPSRWRTHLRRALVKRAAGFIAYGTTSRDYLVQLGARPEDVSIGINTVDTRFFSIETDRHRAMERHRPGRAGGEGRPLEKARILSVGYLTPRKQVHRLLEAVERLAATRSDFVLDIVGDGEDRARLERHVQGRGLGEYVAFHGFKQRAELPAYLARSRCFVFPSGFDIWGLVLVEAMAAGLPVVSSTRAGAVVDLVEDGVTGFAVDFEETEEVAKRIGWMLDNPALAREMGMRGRGAIEEKASIARSAEGFTEAIMRVLEKGVGRGRPQEVARP